MKKTDAIAKYYKNPKSRFIESGIICRGLGGGDKGITFFDDNVVAKNNAESKKLIPVGDIFSGYTSLSSSTINLGAGEFAVIPAMTYGEREAKYYFTLDKKYANENTKELYKGAFSHSIDIEIDIVLKDIVGKPVSARLVFRGVDAGGSIASLNKFFSCLSVPISVGIEYLKPTDCCGFKKRMDATFGISLEERIRSCVNEMHNVKPIGNSGETAYLVFFSSEEGYQFKVMGVRIYEHYISEDYPNSPFDAPYGVEDTFKKSTLKEDVSRRISFMKYPNGAYKGVIIRPTYPMFNDSAVEEHLKSVMMATLPQWKSLSTNCIDISNMEDFTSDVDFVKYTADGRAYIEVCTNQGLTCALNGVYTEDQDGNLIELYINPDEKGDNESDIDASYKNFSSVREYMSFIGANNLWQPIGDFYSCLGAVDNLVSMRNGFHSAVVLFNPNFFPVEVSYVTYI